MPRSADQIRSLILPIHEEVLSRDRKLLEIGGHATHAFVALGMLMEADASTVSPSDHEVRKRLLAGAKWRTSRAYHASLELSDTMVDELRTSHTDMGTLVGEGLPRIAQDLVGDQINTVNQTGLHTRQAYLGTAEHSGVNELTLQDTSYERIEPIHVSLTSCVQLIDLSSDLAPEFTGTVNEYLIDLNLETKHSTGTVLLW